VEEAAVIDDRQKALAVAAALHPPPPPRGCLLSDSLVRYMQEYLNHFGIAGGVEVVNDVTPGYVRVDVEAPFPGRDLHIAMTADVNSCLPAGCKAAVRWRRPKR